MQLVKCQVLPLLTATPVRLSKHICSFQYAALRLRGLKH